MKPYTRQNFILRKQILHTHTQSTVLFHTSETGKFTVRVEGVLDEGESGGMESSLELQDLFRSDENVVEFDDAKGCTTPKHMSNQRTAHL